MSHEEISPRTQELLRRPIAGQVHFTDVASETSGNDRAWWQTGDFDAELTIKYESSVPSGVELIPIGRRPWLTDYGLVLADNLRIARQERVDKLAYASDDELHPDQLAERQDVERALILVANQAYRDETNVADGHNGSDFYLGITDSGTEIYGTPLSFLGGLEARNRITNLYRIPTKGHPEFDGDHEQFRSARIVRSRRHPDHVVPVFEYPDRTALLAAKAAGSHPDIIPIDQRPGHIAYIDKFGNVRAELRDIRRLPGMEKIGKLATLLVRNHGQEHEIGVSIAEDLRSAPSERLAIYANCSDYSDPGSTVGYFELISRVNDNPSTSTKTAAYLLRKAIPNLDLQTAEIDIVS